MTVCLAVSANAGLVFHTAFLGGMNTRLNVDPEKDVIFIYDGAPAHNNPPVPAANTELKKLPPYSPFLDIVEQAIGTLKAAIRQIFQDPKFNI